MPSRPDLADALLAYDLFWLELSAARVDDEGREYFAANEELRDGAVALLRHARGLEDYFAGRWEPADPAAPAETTRSADVPRASPVDAMLARALAPVWTAPPPRSVEAVKAARLLWEIGRQIEPLAIASGLDEAFAKVSGRESSLRADLLRLHERFSDRLERLAAAFVHPMPAFATPAIPAADGVRAGDSASSADSATPEVAEAGDAGKDRRVKGELWFELTGDGSRVKRAHLASDKKTGAVTFGDQIVQRAAEQLFIRAAGDGSFTREDIRDVLDEFRMSDASRDKVRDELDHAICRAVGAVGKGRGKPKAFTLANKVYASDIRFRCLNGDDSEARENRRVAEAAYAQYVGRRGDRGSFLHCFNDQGDEVDP